RPQGESNPYFRREGSLDLCGDRNARRGFYTGPRLPGAQHSRFRAPQSLRLGQTSTVPRRSLREAPKGDWIMKTLGKLSGFAAVAGLSAMLAMPVAPAQAQTSVQTSDALLGAGIGALAGGVLGHGNVGSVLGGAAAGAVIGAL